jgi:retinol dehydrogenase-13
VATKQLTKQNFEVEFGVNHVGHFLLTQLLMDKLKASQQARIINVSSHAHKGMTLNFDDLNYEKEEWVGFVAYGRSKLANVYFTRYLNTILQRDNVQNVKVCSLHPGGVKTEIFRQMFRDDQKCAKCCFNVICAPCAALCCKNPL